MIGRVKNISRFGLFVKFDAADGSQKTGLLRWSNLTKAHPKYQPRDLIAVRLLEEKEDGKIELASGSESFQKIFRAYLTDSAQRLSDLEAENQRLLGH